MKKNIPYLVAATLLWLLFAQAVRGAVVLSLAFDEGPHLAVGYATLRTGDFRLQPVHIHPPLAKLLGAFVYRWAADLAGWKAGLLALFLYALDPNIVAHAQVITTDMGVTVFGFAALYC